jgi:hypothetical protein
MHKVPVAMALALFLASGAKAADLPPDETGPDADGVPHSAGRGSTSAQTVEVGRRGATYVARKLPPLLQSGFGSAEGIIGAKPDSFTNFPRTGYRH